ncbi:hypothetical protein A3F64_02350 [Candidatus Saccharibacteria bacterium RIFCSPHIGHO2_12_FULL_42_8]|nr:MAG: hypothetical protein A3F64_02350 [Candidatus Saccharibacteria bacterium RIFCSPHIGHO2_12_FULL_42_8]
MEHPTTTDLLAEDIQDVLVESKILMSELYVAKQALMKSKMGEVNYQRAQDFMATRQTADTFFDGIDSETMQQLEKLDENTCVELARDRLSLEPLDEQGYYLKDWAENIARNLYPNDTTQTVLEDREKLTKVGAILKKLADDDEIHNNEYQGMYSSAFREVDEKVAELYAEITGQSGIELVEVDESSFGIFFHDSIYESERDTVLDDPDMDLFQSMEAIAEISRASIVISVVNDELRIQNEAVEQKIQLEEIRAALQPIPKIIEALEKEITV